MKYIKTTKQNGMVIEPAIKSVIDSEPKTDKKSKLRYEIQEEVFDLGDSVADNAKLISLMFAMSVAMYNALPDDIKDNVPDDVRTKIEYAIAKFGSIETWGQIQLDAEGNEAIDKLLDRQAKIGDIVKDINYV